MMYAHWHSFGVNLFQDDNFLDFSSSNDAAAKAPTVKPASLESETPAARPQTAPSGRRRGNSTGWGDLGEEFDWPPKNNARKGV